ncbi:dTDP-4-dehydrorhamnose reductase [bacterium C-53]|nr:dTDP-4-dehydrorhamnose reductase [Lachnospiraceae bacterium]NBI01620.1 dTDP-4-dehydrorhamnose reductase [Lachnospiraceae bacterium]RKJ12915.1 dTDP-4-dehydrorhamnose reductase [bacterium C-53]
MKTLIITGCNGQLGRAINKELEGSSEYKLVNTDVEELDITDVNAVLAFVREHKPYAILNCAAYTAVEACETERDLAYKINAVGPRNLSLAAAETGAKLVQVSTDYVFAGDGDHPYEEFDLTYPQGVYGASKLAGENYVKEFADRYFIIRTAWLYGEGKNFVRTMLRLSETNDKVRVVNDQFGCPTSAKELAKAILYLLPTDNYGLFHGTCEGSCSWADFASEIFRLAGKSTVVEGISTEEYGAKVKRPAYSVLDNYMFRLTTDFQFAHWKDALREYMEETV